MKVVSKPWYQSKMMWLGILEVVASVGLIVTGEVELYEALLGVNGLAVVLLRLVTSQKIV